MGMIDLFDYLSKEQAVTVTAVSTDVKDLGLHSFVVGYNVGVNPSQFLRSFVKAEDFAGGTSITASIETSATSAFTATTIVQTGATSLTAAATIGTRLIEADLYSLRDVLLRYVRVRYTIAGTMTAGKVSTYLTAG